MKRIIGFLLGISLGVLFAYLLRRYLLNQAPTPEAVTIPPPKTEEPPAFEPKPATTLIIRRNGPRPGAVSSETNGTHISVNGRATESTPSQSASETVTPDVQVADPVVEAQAQPELETPEASTDQPDDFTVIIDIGPVFNRKLQDAGITTFKAMSELSAEEIAEKVGTNAARIDRNRWREQAAQLASGAINVEVQKAENSEKAEG